VTDWRQTFQQFISMCHQQYWTLH